ncbi:MAG: Asp23/Gls24 family envelope stress response protein [Sporolactobacillus sp.]|mgnify:CR=1 FL=1|jgi:uncharacterized alkaline shock family protein YloU|nr:Asp23/Gls24 family envelope stress response protein [Sporolactobacillus sp.]MCI1882461.1 Asp23/Gls24 family envelope stress response protein [Sporolactobacillus sp.]
MTEEEKQPRNEEEREEEMLGKIEISPEVIEIIASLAALEVVGVADTRGGFASGVVEKLGGKNLRKGVKVDLRDDGIVIDVQLTTQMGVSIPEVAEKVQSNIARALKKMTALETREINIHVVGIRFSHKPNHEADNV